MELDLTLSIVHFGLTRVHEVTIIILFTDKETEPQTGQSKPPQSRAVCVNSALCSCEVHSSREGRGCAGLHPGYTRHRCNVHSLVLCKISGAIHGDPG